MISHSSPADGILIHMLLGKLKKSDIPGDVRDNCIREMLSKGIAPPPEFSRPEVAKILMAYYQTTL